MNYVIVVLLNSAENLLMVSIYYSSCTYFLFYWLYYNSGQYLIYINRI